MARMQENDKPIPDRDWLMAVCVTVLILIAIIGTCLHNRFNNPKTKQNEKVTRIY